MFQVAEIQGGPLLFQPAVLLPESLFQLDQPPENGQRPLPFLLHRRKGPGAGLFQQPFHFVRKAVPQGFQPVEKILVFAPHRSHSGLCPGRQSMIAGVPALLGPFSDGFGPFQTGRKGRTIALLNGGRKGDLLQSLPQLVLPEGHGPIAFRQALLAEGGLRKLAPGQAFHGGQGKIQKPFRVRMAHQGVIQMKHRPPQVLVPPLFGEILQSGQEIRVLSLAFIPLFQGILQGLLLQQTAFALFQQPEGRGQTQQGKILPHQPQAKGMDRLNGGRAQQSQLTAKTARGRVQSQLIQQTLADALAHFHGGRIGKGDDEHLG